MNKKTKRYEEGGEIEFETMQGQNKNIGDDVRTRAMAAMEKGSSDEPAVPKKTAAKLTPKAEAPKREKANPTYTAPPKMAAADRVKKEREKSAKKSSGTTDYAMGNAMRSGGKVSSASKRADGCAIRGKTRA